MTQSITPVKTDSVVVLSHQAATHPTTIIGSSIDCTTKISATLFLFHGYVEATADTNPGRFLIQVRPDPGNGSVNEHWITVMEMISKGTTPDDENMTATEPVGETVLACASTTGFAVNDPIYIQNTTLADSEFAQVRSIQTNTSLTIVEGLTVQQTNTSKIFNDATLAIFWLDLTAISSYRVIWTHEGATGANGHVKAFAIHHDSTLVT